MLDLSCSSPNFDYLWFNYLSDIPLVVELSGTKNETGEKVVKQRIWKICTRSSPEELIKAGINREIIRLSKESHSRESMTEFMNECKLSRSYEQCDWDCIRKELDSVICAKCDLTSGIKIKFLYKSRFSVHYLINLIKSE